MTDLDTRVASLMQISQEWRNYETSTKDFEQAIRAELQKPALHEPVSDQETIDAIRTHHLKVTTESMIDMRRTLEVFLQGRAQPAQEEITDAESKKWLLRSAKAEALLRRVHRLMPIFEKGVGQLTFTAETGGEIYAEMRAIQLELSGHTEESWTEAALRASKGEKT